MEICLLGIDLGTTNVKAVLFSESGRQIAMGQDGYETYYPAPSAAEQEANDWWRATVSAIRQIVGSLDMRDIHIAAISVSSQSPTLLPLGKDGNPLRRGMIWMDRRAEKESAWLVGKFGEKEFKEKFGMKGDAFYLMPKLIWLKKYEPEIYRKTKKVLMTNTYVNYKLTGEMAIDDQQASSITMAFDPNKKDWSNEIEAVTDVPIHDLMPEIYPVNGVIGQVTRKAAAETGLKEGIPVVCGTTDGSASILEAGITHLSEAAEITGTSTLFFAAHAKPLSENSMLIGFPQCFPIPEVPYILGGPINSSGASLKWYVNTYKRSMDAAEKEMGEKNPYNILNVIAEKGPAGSKGLLYFPYLSGERAPLWNSYVKGMFIGMTAASKEEHIVRSIYEGTSFALRSVVEETYREGGVINKFRSAGGGANSDIWLKIKASMLNMPLEVSVGQGGAPLGDAIIAGYGVGLYKDFVKAVETFQRIDKVIEPVKEWVRIYDDIYPLYMKMLKSLDESLRDLETLVAKDQL